MGQGDRGVWRGWAYPLRLSPYRDGLDSQMGLDTTNSRVASAGRSVKTLLVGVASITAGLGKFTRSAGDTARHADELARVLREADTKRAKSFQENKTRHLSKIDR